MDFRIPQQGGAAMSGTGFKSMTFGVILALLASSSSFAQDVEDKGGPDLLASMTANVARRLEAQNQPSLFVPGAPRPAAIATLRQQPNVQSAPSQSGNLGRKIAYGVALGFAGMYGGAFIGSRFGQNCHCDDPGLEGAVWGALIGASAGAWFGTWLGGR
jgi:hypothetical protein